MPRGRILDRNGNVLVDNASKKQLHIREVRRHHKEKFLKQQKLSSLIDMKTDKITKRDKQDFWIQLHPEKRNP